MGELIIDGNAVEIGGLIFEKEISRGANGIVYKAYDSILEREVTFKIWVKLRAAFFKEGAEFVGWPYYRKFGTYELTLAESKDWDSFDGRTAKRGD